MRIRYTAIYLVSVLLVMIVFYGCQSTPNEDIVVNKGDGEMEAIIAGPTASPQIIISEERNSSDIDGTITYSEEWEETYTLPYLVCEIDADVILPTVNEFPVLKVQQCDFDSETVRKIVDYFTADATGVRDTSVTKEELEAQLVQVKRGTYVWDDNGGRWESYEGQEEDIAALEEQIANAEEVVFDPITDDIVSVHMQKTYTMSNKERIYVYVDSREIDISPIKYGVIQLESWVVIGEAYPGEPEGTTIDNVTISEEDACEVVNKLLSELKIDNFGIAETEKARIIEDYTYEIVSEGWQITLTRDDGDSVPIYISSSEVSGLLQYESEDYAYRWQPESIKIYVDENGPRSFYWQNPIEVVETMNSNVPIITFDEIKETIRDYIRVC